MKKITFLILLYTGLSVTCVAQLSIDAASTDYTISFDATVAGVTNGQYQGSGFQSAPTAGQLDSDAWAAEDMSDGDLSFGGTATTGDYARGTSTGGVTSGGFYAFDIGSGDYIFGIQPGGSDWTPGTVTLKLVNNTGSTITSLDIEYDIEEYNDQGRANSLNFSHSSDDVSYTSVPALDHTTVEAAAPSPGWVNFNKSTTLTGLSIADGANYYLRWEGDDVSGGGSRDEYGFHNVVVNATTGVSNSAESDIVKASGWSEPTNIDYTMYSAASSLTTTNAIEVGKFTIRDGGAAASDSDSESTSLTAVTYTVGNFNNVQALALFDGTTNVSEQTTVTSSTTFSGITGLSAADDATKDFTVYATFKTNVTDNDNIKFTIISASADGAGSTFAAGDAGGAETDDTGDNNKLVVTATELAMTAPSTVVINSDFTVEVEATDANGSRDLDEASSITLAKASGTGTLSSVTGLTQTLSSGYYSWTDAQYDIAEDFTVEGQSGTLTNATSGTITALGSVNTDLFISEVTDPNDVANAKYVEIYNAGTTDVDFSSITWYLCRQANGSPTSWGDVLLTGSIAAGDKYVVAYSTSTFTSSYGFAPDQASGNISGNGDDGYFLFYNGNHTTGTLIDAYGVIDEDGTGKLWEYTNTRAVRDRSVTGPRTDWKNFEWIIPASADVADMTPGAHNEDYTWAGTTDTDWETLSNWSGSPTFLPSLSSNVSIADVTNDPDISGDALCYKLTMLSASSLDVNSGGTLTVYEDLDMPTSKSTNALADFTLKSDATGDGSVILFGYPGEEITVERYIVGHGGVQDAGWHLIGSPIDIMNVEGSNFEPGDNDDLYIWNELEYQWDNYKASTEWTTLEETYGYLVAYESTSTKDFYGYTSNWDFPLTDLSKTTGKGEGWHLLGNPFPSALEWNTDDWGLSGIGGVAQIWDNGNYTLINPGSVIPSTNGFFIQASSSTNSMTIPASARLHDSQGFYKNGSEFKFYETLELWITNDENQYSDLTRVGFKLDATESWDTEYDAHKLYGSRKAPQLWSVTNGDDFAQSFLPYTSEEYPVSLHFRAGVNGTYHINADGLNSFSLGTDIFLEDVLMDKIIDLNEQSMYTFTASTDDDDARFILHFYGVTSTGDTPETEMGKVYAYQNTVFVQLNDQLTSAYQVEVINMVGQQIYSNEFVSGGLNSFKLNVKPGIYFVRLRADNKTMVQKVMISK